MERHRGDRDRDWDRERDRERDRDRDRDRFGDDSDVHRYRRPSRFSDAPTNANFRRSPGNFHSGFSPGGGGGGPRSFDSPPGAGGVGVAGASGGGFRPMGPPGDGGFLPMGEGGFDANFQPPLSGQKRGFPFPARSGASPENYERRTFVKLFIGSVPKTATEEDIRPMFEEHGNVIEVTLIKDKRTGQQQGCCFVKYATSEEANRAIQFLHNQYTLPGGIGPIQVRYADGECERLGNVEYKLFVGSLNKHATKKEVEEIFVPYGRVEDVYLMRDDRRQSRGCGFVKLSQRDSAMAAINALNGIYTMRGCDQPLIVRFADPKRPRTGEQRGGPSFGGPGFAAIPTGARPPHVLSFADTMGAQGPPSSWQPTSPQNIGASQNAGSHGMIGGSHGSSQGVFTDGSIPSFAVPSSSMSPQTQMSRATGRQAAQLQFPHASSQMPYSHGLPSQQLPGYSGTLPASQSQAQQNLSSSAPNQAPLHANLQSNTGSAMVNPLQLPTSMSVQLSLHQSPSQLAQMLAQQRQSLQASLQSSQQAFSQLQQQIQLMHPSNPNQQLQHNFQTAKQQPEWGSVPQAAGSASGVAPSNDVHSSKPTGPAAPAVPSAAGPLKCNWTEHVSPDGFKYYYNSVTGESRWTKPEELALYEQQQPKLAVRHPQGHPSLIAIPSQHVPQSQQPQLQTQFQHPERLQQIPISSSYQTPGTVDNQNVQGHQAAQEWIWKNKSGGS